MDEIIDFQQEQKKRGRGRPPLTEEQKKAREAAQHISNMTMIRHTTEDMDLWEAKGLTIKDSRNQRMKWLDEEALMQAEDLSYEYWNMAEVAAALSGILGVEVRDHHIRRSAGTDRYEEMRKNCIHNQLIGAENAVSASIRQSIITGSPSMPQATMVFAGLKRGDPEYRDNPAAAIQFNLQVDAAQTGANVAAIYNNQDLLRDIRGGSAKLIGKSDEEDPDRR